MIRFVRANRLQLFMIVSILCILVYAYLSIQTWKKGSEYSEQSGLSSPVVSNNSAQGKVSPADPGKAAEDGFPDESTFSLAAENSNLELRASPETGHFIVKDKRTGHVWRSFASPEGWQEKENAAAWNIRLRSPFILRYVEFNVRKDLLKETNFIEQGGSITRFEHLDNGVRFEFSLPELGFVIPIEVRLYDDYVETKIIDSGLVDGKDSTEKEDPMSRLVSIQPYPFLGAVTSGGQDGYLLVPDGSGALIRFRSDRAPSSSLYEGKIYGEDWSYSYNSNLSTRLPIKMPVYGIKSGSQAMIGIVHDGAEYANILAAPSKAFSQYNWVTQEFQYRFKYVQPANTQRWWGITVYSEERIHSDMGTRYYFLDNKEPQYADMAAYYRNYLIDEAGVKPAEGLDGPIPLHLNLLAADTKRGFLADSYLPLTTTDEAKSIVSELNGLGIDHLSIVYTGWQNGGYSKYGGPFPVDSGIGGNQGMKEFIDYAHSKSFPVYLNGQHYSYNNTGRGGFRKSRDGLRDLGQAVIDYRTWGSQTRNTFVSPKFVEKTILNDLAKAKSLNADGFQFGTAIGAIVNSDYNDQHAVTRTESRLIQERIFQETKEVLGKVQVSNGNSYVMPYVSHMRSGNADYSKDLFIDEAVPFAQIAMHGLISYSFGYANESDDYIIDFLKAIEYGAEPSFVITYAPTRSLIETYSLRGYYSTDYRDWTTQMVTAYQKFNGALGDVRNAFISGHRKITDGVYETTYSSGKRIVVNYKDTPYAFEGVTVQAKDFAVIKEGS
ncbi:DUF5696 domain-containing protein [Paenibacillus sp. IITD108]|uniref:DUF5696 domain-containing protein n=1 Tax=Paenibacillus sp. IITD108 TaxID=3116649 RepID=UPI002F3E2AF9